MKACIFTVVGLLGFALFAQTAAARDPWDGRPVYGHELMTKAEIQEHRATMEALETREEKLAFWYSEVERMQQRSLDWGVQLPDPPKYRDPDAKPVVRDRKPYFIEIMTDDEVAAYYDGVKALEYGSPERRAYKANHIMRMRARGFTRGINVPETHDWNYVFENGLRPPDLVR
jgi:hypothetical protein